MQKFRLGDPRSPRFPGCSFTHPPSLNQNPSLAAEVTPAWGWAMVHLSAAGPFFGAESYEACYLTVARGIKSGEFDVPHPQYGRDLLLGTILSAMVTTLREGGARTQPRIIAHYLLRALGVPDRKAREIAASPLPEIAAPQ
jgi:hypothetical protein